MNTQISIITVSELNRHVKGFLESEIGVVHVQGEVSNLSKPSSGHLYFTLKDKSAQIKCAFFKNRQNSLLSGGLADGQLVVATGKLSIYEARGDYQLIVEHLADAGLGALYQKFEELKNKLAAEGLFNSEKKRPLPAIPATIGIIASPSSAALQDILSTLARRFPFAKIIIYPSEVQGTTAPKQLISALHQANTEKRCEVLVLARGGGSIEDLWAFNDEHLARKIAASSLPIVSGVGHETDFTIADFVADLRAETPTAAAIAVTPDNKELINYFNKTNSSLHTAILRIMQTHKIKVQHLTDKLFSPTQTINTHWQRLDYVEKQLLSSMSRILTLKQHQLHLGKTQLNLHNPKVQISQTKIQIQQLAKQMQQHMRTKLKYLQQQLTTHLSTLQAVSPLATLDRGYAIAQKDNKVLYQASNACVGDKIDVRLAQGSLECEVIKVK